MKKQSYSSRINEIPCDFSDMMEESNGYLNGVEYGFNSGLSAASCIAVEADARIERLEKALRDLLTLSESADETGYVEGEGWLPIEKIQEAARLAINHE